MSVLMIGLDGATFTLLNMFCEQGVTPFLKSLIDGGTKAGLMSTRNPLTPPAWTSMTTGRSPEAHGIYDFLRPSFLNDGSVYLKVNDSRYNHSETLWSMANRGGLRATALNFYGHAPAPKIDGYVISGFVPWKYLRQGIHPAGLFDEIKGLNTLDYKNLGMDIGEEKKCVQGLLEGEHEDWIELQNVRDAAWADVTCMLMNKDRTDITAVVLDGPDKIQHLFWRFLDPEYASEDDDEWVEEMRARSIDFYRGMDENIRKMVEAAGPDTDVLIVSDHGFGPTTEIFYVNEWLSRNGYLTWSNVAENDDVGQLTAEKIKDHLGMIDWKKTKAFSPTPSSNAIYLKKDFGNGVGVTEDDYLDFCLKLRDELLNITDPVNGEKIVTAVDLNKMRGTGFVEPCPDLTLHLRDGGFVSILHADEVLKQREHPDGTHRPEGVFIGYGPSFEQGKHVDALNLLDMTPLMLTLLGLPVPNDLEGRVPLEVLKGDREVKKAAKTVTVETAEDDNEPTEEEREALLKQMKILGYMD
ncbi:alkaline phosphatase family protein [Actibacterium sp.]|uniref:alkaline phosphatase family protein n=1 Tax=Actibacterium sp. TaxID=1872125 RepID=UPI0035635AAD